MRKSTKICTTWPKIGNFRDVLHNQSTGSVLNQSKSLIIKIVNLHKLFENYLCSFKFFYKSSSLCHFKWLRKSSRCYTIYKYISNTHWSHTHRFKSNLHGESCSTGCPLYLMVIRATFLCGCTLLLITTRKHSMHNMLCSMHTVPLH